jgi:hypothetical protein
MDEYSKSENNGRLQPHEYSKSVVFIYLAFIDHEEVPSSTTLQCTSINCPIENRNAEIIRQ